MIKLLIVSAILLFAGVAIAGPNECAAKVRLVNVVQSQPKSTTWKFVFAVTTNCAASAGSFEFSYRPGKDQPSVTKRSSAWTASDGKSFELPTEVNIGQTTKPIDIAVDAKTVVSTKQQ